MKFTPGQNAAFISLILITSVLMIFVIILRDVTAYILFAISAVCAVTCRIIQKPKKILNTSTGEYQASRKDKKKFLGHYALILALIRWMGLLLGVAIFYFLFVLYVMEFGGNFVSPDDPLNIVLAFGQALAYLAHAGYSIFAGTLIDCICAAFIVYTIGRLRHLEWLSCLLCSAANGVITWFVLTNGMRVFNSSITFTDLQIFYYPAWSILWISVISASFAFLLSRTYYVPS